MQDILDSDIGLSSLYNFWASPKRVNITVKENYSRSPLHLQVQNELALQWHKTKEEKADNLYICL